MPVANEKHVHPKYRTGLLPHGVADTQLLSMGWRAGKIPDYEPAVDRLSSITIGLDGNDNLGDCGPTSCDNWRRIQTLFGNGTEVQAPLADVMDLYSRATSPPFQLGPPVKNDNGVNMVDLMKAMQAGGLSGDKILAYAKLKDTSDASIYAAIDIFGAVIFAVDLQVAQQTQTDNGLWDYKKSGEWGGHAIVAAKYDSKTGIVTVGTWGQQVGCTSAFRQHQLGEVWVPIHSLLLKSNKFVTTVDTAALGADFSALTGGELPVAPSPGPSPQPPAPSPTPTPTPTGNSYLSIGPFNEAQMTVIQRRAAKKNETPSDYVLHLVSQGIKANFVDKLEALFHKED